MDKHTVDPLYVGPTYVTNVWISERAVKNLKKLSASPDVGKLLDKVAYWAESGFAKWEGSPGSGRPIVHEWDGVFRLGYRSLHRILGFYENNDKRLFVAIDAFLKKSQKLSSAERGYINEVAKIKKLDLWERR